MVIAVVDGQGGGIGRTVVEQIRRQIPEARVIGLGTNSAATGQMLKAGAHDGATGENAIVHNVSKADIVVGVIGVLVANSMMGELSPAMAQAIGSSPAHKVLLPLNRCGVHVVGVASQPMGNLIEEAVEQIKELMEIK